MLLFRCVLPHDDPFRSCFGCESGYEHIFNKPRGHYNPKDYPIGQGFQATNQNGRVICGNAERQTCRLRIDIVMQLRGVTYGRALQFVQSEQYLGDEESQQYNDSV